MEEITPNYYAIGEEVDKFELIGSVFDLIPDDALGVLSNQNNDPLLFKDTENLDLILDITEKSDTGMTLVPREITTHGLRFFLGGIVSADRQTIYWVNDTKPLP